MKEFAYRAASPAGRIHKGVLRAENENDLSASLEQKNLELIEAREKSEKRFSLPRRHKGDASTIQAFAAQTEDLLRAGIPFAQALGLIVGTMDHGPTRDKMSAVEAAICAGTGIAQAFRVQGEWQDEAALALLVAGEKSGDLTSSFSRITAHFGKKAAFHKMFLRAVRYPLFLVCVAGGATGFMMLWVVPQIVAFLLNEGGSLPVATRFLIFAADLFASFWWIFPLGAFAGYLGLSSARTFSRDAAIATDKVFLRLPFLGPVLRNLALARMSQSLALLIKSGLLLPDAFDIAKTSFGNLYLVECAKTAHKKIVEGASFSQACRDLFCPFHLQMLKIAEKSASLPRALESMAQGLEDHAQESLARFLGALEPALTLCVGAFLAWVVLAVFGPLYGALGALAGGYS